MTGGSVERIAHYRILRRLGRGGMGIVYQAEDERDSRVVALKVIREAETAGPEGAPHVAEARVRFDREAEILKSLLHVNVVSFFEIGEEDGTPYLAMEFLDGVAISHFAGRPYAETLPLLIQAAHGMEYLASRGIVHRDLSPDNVFVVEVGGERIVKLLDFGVAKLFEAATGLESLTATGFFLGKVAYGSPEQLGLLGQGAALDWRSDVYSLGLVFYQVLSGRRPFEGRAPVEYIAAHLNLTAPPVAAPPGQPPLPMGLVRLVSQMLEKRREDRPRSYREIVDRLVSALRSAPGEAASPGPAAAGRTAERDRSPTGPTALVAASSTRRGLPSRLGWPPRGTRRAAAGLATVGALVAVLVWIGREVPPPATAGTAPRPSARPATGPSGPLRILATPWASVLSIAEASGGRSVPLPSGSATPLLLDPVPAGTYRVVLSCPAAGGARVERVVTVVAGAGGFLAETFQPPERLVETFR